MKKNSLNIEIWKYFLIFSILILSFLWIFQGAFLNQYYRYGKTKDIKNVANLIVSKQSSRNLEKIINNAAYKNGVCVEIINSSYNTLYSSSSYGRGCFTGKDITMNYKYDFLMSSSNSKTYELINPMFNNNALVYAVKLENNRYVFVNTSLDPIDSTVKIIQEQLVIVTIVVLVLSFVISYFISNFISAPIVRMNKSAKELAKGNFDVKFDSEVKISELDELSRTLNYASSELSKTDELRRDLMANVSHDLKTPLTMIKAYAEMSVDLHQNSKTKRKKDMKVIVEEVDRLTILVNDILSLSKMESSIDNLEYEEFDLIKLINDVLDRYHFLKETEDYIFEFNYNKDELVVCADKRKLEQVIYNLINNAINYTGEDKKVQINVFRQNYGILVQVIDTGKGIKDEDLAYIWDRYYKNKKKHKRNLVGTGLGLAIVKNILLLHGYEHGVNSKAGNGSCFYFIINKKN